ncbi:hypothetical protein LINGRAHAP2_LOCUS10346 [Linum grandiflorum]
MESRLAAEEDDEKWFMLFVMLLIANLFKPQAGVNMKADYLGIFLRADAPPIEDYNWCQHLLEIFDKAKIGKKGYIEAYLNLMLELRVRRKEPGKELSTRKAKKCLPVVGPATKCLLAVKTTVGVRKVVSTVGANKRPPSVRGFGGARSILSNFRLQGECEEHEENDDYEEEEKEEEEKEEEEKKKKKKKTKETRNSEDVIPEIVNEDEQLIRTESGGFEAPDEAVNVGSFSDVADIGLDALLSSPGDDFMKEGFEVYTSQVGSLDPVEDRMEKTFPEDNPEDAVGVESTLKEVGEGEHATSGGSMEVDTDTFVVDNTGVVEEGNSEEEVSKKKEDRGFSWGYFRHGSKRIKYDSRYKHSPFQTLSRKKVIVKNFRLKIQVEAMRMQELAAKEKELEEKEQAKEIVAEQIQEEMEGLDEGIPIEFPGPCTQEFLTRIEALEVFANDIYKDEALSLALLCYIWSEDLPSEKNLYELEDKDYRLRRDNFQGCAPGGEVSNFFVNSFSDMLLQSVATVKTSMQRWIFSPDVACRGQKQPDNNSRGVFALNFLQYWSGEVEDWIKDNWMLPDNVNYRRPETCLRLLFSTTNSLKNDVCTKTLKAFPLEEEDSEDDKEGT